MNVVNTIKAAAKIKDPNLYSEIVNLDLSTKEFKYHTKCYNSFTYGIVVQREKEKKCQQMTIVCNIIPNLTGRL